MGNLIRTKNKYSFKNDCKLMRKKLKSLTIKQSQPLNKRKNLQTGCLYQRNQFILKLFFKLFCNQLTIYYSVIINFCLILFMYLQVCFSLKNTWLKKRIERRNSCPKKNFVLCTFIIYIQNLLCLITIYNVLTYNYFYYSYKLF